MLKMKCKILNLILCAAILCSSFSGFTFAVEESTQKEPVSILSWEWEDPEKLLVKREETDGWVLGLPGASNEHRVTAEALKELLPTHIIARFSDQSKKSIPLNWNFSPIPENGAYMGSCTLTAVLPERYILGENVPMPSVLLELGGGETMAIKKSLYQWKWTECKGTLTGEKDTAELRVEADRYDIAAIRKALQDALPQSVYCYGNYDAAMTAGGFRLENPDTAAQGTRAYGWLPLHWEESLTDSNLEKLVKDHTCTLTAYNRSTLGSSGDGSLDYYYKLYNNDSPNSNEVAQLTLKVTVYVENGLQLEKHIVTESVVQPPDVTVNLFDYWVNTEIPINTTDILKKEARPHRRESGYTASFSGFAQFNHGINKDHLLIFGDGLVHAGLWNKGAGESTAYGKKWAGMESIVRNTLEDGYPVINTTAARQQLINGRDYKLIMDWKLAGDHVDELEPNGTVWTYDGKNVQNLSETLINNWEKSTGQSIENGTESLAYLFHPEILNDYKKSYQNVTGLFQLDDNGYYYYNMRDNFAEFDQSTNSFILYDRAATKRTDALNSLGNFLPFNKGTEVFSGIDQNGNLYSNVMCSAPGINHHLGMTIDVNFRQPVGGQINAGTNKADMIFEFSGDDDVWVFIDDVLVLDLGGIHSEIYGTINFATGDVYIGRAFSTNGIPSDPSDPAIMVTHTTLKALFEAAGKDVADSVKWNGNTFDSNTNHSLKMFYLERGNYDSSLALRFNLVPRLFQQIKKVDQDGKPLAGAEFALFDAEKSEDGTYTATGSALTTLLTNDEGIALFIEPNSITAESPDGEPFNFADRYINGKKYYILKETITPPGYRTLPVDVVLEFYPETAMLVVVNPWVTGAYASFVSNIAGNSHITYGKFDESSGDILPDLDRTVSLDCQQSGLVIAIPMLLEKEAKQWKALYGSNVTGFRAVTPSARTAVAWREAVLTAFLYQCASIEDFVPNWYLVWNENTKRLEGTLSDLPGRADRYQLNNSDGDMKMVYAIIDQAAFQALGISTNQNDREQYEAIASYINRLVADGMSLENAVTQVKNEIITANGPDGRGFHFLNTDQFNRNFRSLIYIPNEQRELRIWKVDQDGKPVNGAEFTLYRRYENGELSDEAAHGITAQVDGQSGALIFTPSPEREGETVKPGYAEMSWVRNEQTQYYLKETKAPDGYVCNETVIPVMVGIYSIYADAGTPDDGVTVMAGVGKLAQTMSKYAADEEVNITLRDIIAYAQVQASGRFQADGWESLLLEGTNVRRSMNLHYGKNAIVDYGLHSEDGGETLYPFFVTDTGFITARIQQNWNALGKNSPYGDSAKNTANKENLGDTDLTSLFSLLNIVVITDPTQIETKTGALTVSKKVSGEALEEQEYVRNFTFRLTLTDSEGKELGVDQKFYFYGTNKSGYICSGGTILLHHDESITILGLPEGVKYTVLEDLPSDVPYTSVGGVIREGVIQASASADVVPAAAEYLNVPGVPLSFSFRKVDAVDQKIPLAGARFALYWWTGEGLPDSDLIPLEGLSPDSGWHLISQIKSGENGMVAFDSLLTGVYRLVETAAPGGYILPKSQWQFSLDRQENGTAIVEKISTVGNPDEKPPAFAVIKTETDGQIVYTYQLPNLSELRIPVSGGSGQRVFWVVGIILFCIALNIAVLPAVPNFKRKNRKYFK